MKLIYELLTQSNKIVIRQSLSMTSIALIKVLVEILKKDFPDATDDQIMFEYFVPPEYRYESCGISYKYLSNQDAIPAKYKRLNQ